MAHKLSDSEIKHRLQEGRNYKRLYYELKHKFDAVLEIHAQCPTALTEQKAYFEAIVETQNTRITELETMVFGRKPSGGLQAKAKTILPKQQRTKDSYRRPLPSASAVTVEEHHTITDCHRCGHALSRKDEAIRYEEDIVLAALTPDIPHQTVTKHTVETGWCSRCGQYSSARDLRGQVVTLGPIARSLIVYLVIQADQTYAQTQDLLWQLYRFKVSSSEIATILDGRRTTHLSHYERLKSNVRAGPSHMDETSYPIQSEQGSGYAHVMAGADGTPAEHDVVYKLADSRGKGNSEDLVGTNYQSVGITDRYAAYKHLFVLHQICWAHLQRTARDLTRMECLGQRKQRHVIRYYQALARIYSCIRVYQIEAFDRRKREQQAVGLLAQVTTLCQPHQLDPKKLTDLKAGILEYRDCLFLCLTIDSIPADNNKAERLLRKLVIKRKKSFGVKTMKGARTMEVLLSVCQSLYNRDRDNFLTNLHVLATGRG